MVITEYTSARATEATKYWMKQLNELLVFQSLFNVDISVPWRCASTERRSGLGRPSVTPIRPMEKAKGGNTPVHKHGNTGKVKTDIHSSKHTSTSRNTMEY